MSSLTLDSPVGTVTFTEADGAIVRLTWLRASETRAMDDTPLLKDAARQIQDYFAGDRIEFDLPLAPTGSGFQRAVWDEMLKIPFGETRTYGDLAQAIGGAAQPVGTACGDNPIPILIPCHRVVATGGGLGGFSGGTGLPTKKALLAHEGAAVMAQGDLFG